MKVLHVSRSDCLDSASRAALQLHRRLRARAVESRMLVRERCRADEPGVVLLPHAEHADADLFSIVQDFCFDQNEKNAPSSCFQLGYPGELVMENPELDWCDVIHLHQLAGFLSPAAIRSLHDLGKPVLWSLPDAWPLTGGCFQPGDCRGFRAACEACPQLRDDAFRLPHGVLQDKKKRLGSLENLTLCAAGNWLADAARDSAIFNGTRVEKFSGTFFDSCPRSPRDPAQPLQFVFVCETSAARTRSLIQLLELAQTYGAFRQLVRSGRVSLIFAGPSPEDMAGMELPMRCLDRAEHAKLDTVFAEADLVILPNLSENGPAAIWEARAHGVPVLAFDEAGVSEWIEHKVNGWLVRRRELRPMAEAIAYLASNPARTRELARKIAPTDSEAAVEKMVRIYSGLNRGSPRPAPALEIAPDLHAQCDRIVRAVAKKYVGEFSAGRDQGARLAAAEKMLRGANDLIAEAQRNLVGIERRQQQALEAKNLSASATASVAAAQKFIAKLRNKLKWRSRRIRVFGSSSPDADVPLSANSTVPSPPEIAPWARAVHALFLKNHWMRHGRKNQFPPRPLAGEKFPKPKLDAKKLPSIAIVTPSFMQADFVEETIRSVLDQNYPALAYAVQDGGSTDGTLAIIQRYAERLSVWASRPDSGQARAVLDGFEKISGDIMAWVNSDDLFVPGALRFVGEFFATHRDVDAIYGHRIIIDEKSREIARWVVPPHDSRLAPMLDPVPQETLFWRTSLWEKVGGLDASFRFTLDWDLVLRFQHAGAKIVRVPYFLGCFRVHSQQKLSARAESIGAEEIAYLRRRENGRVVGAEELRPYQRWMETYGAIYSRLLELGIRI